MVWSDEHKRKEEREEEEEEEEGEEEKKEMMIRTREENCIDPQKWIFKKTFPNSILHFFVFFKFQERTCNVLN